MATLPHPVPLPESSTVTAQTHAPSRVSSRVSSRVPSLVTYAALVVALLFWCTYALINQLPIGSLVKAGAAIAVLQVLPGALIWRTVRPRDGWLLEDLMMGFAMGFTVAVPAQTIAGLMHSRIPAIVVPLLVIAVFLGVPVLRRRVLEARWTPLSWWMGPLIALLSLVAYPQTRDYFNQNLLWSDQAWRPHVDAYLHQALASEILTRGPVGWPTVDGEDLGYQWFAHAWIAHVTATSGVGLDHVLMRVLPAIMPLLAVGCFVVLGLRLGGPKVAAITAVLSMAGGQGQPWGLVGGALPITPLSPTLGLGIPTLVALVLVLATRWRGTAQRGAFWLIPVLTIIATGTKGSTSPIVIAGLGLAVLAMLLWNRKMVLPIVIDAAVMGVSLVATMAIVFHGSVAGLKLDIHASADQTGLAALLGGLTSDTMVYSVSAAVILAALTRGALAFALPFSRAGRVDPVSWLLIGATIAGAFAVGIFAHPGKSQGYFTATAIPLAAVGSALGAQQLWRTFGARRSLLVAAVGAVAGLVFVKGVLVFTGRLSSRDYDHFWKLAVIAAVVLVVAGVVGAFVGGHKWARTALTAVALTGLLAGVFNVVDALRKTIEHPTEYALTNVRTLGAVTSAELRAARYIRDHSNVEDLVMTNRHCTAPREPRNGCDSRRWLVTAFTERQSLVEGWTATPKATEIAPNGRDSVFVNYWKPQILELNDNFIAAPTADAQKKLWDLGVRWVYVENTRPHANDLAPYATLGLRTKDASAWKLNAPAGG